MIKLLALFMVYAVAYAVRVDHGNPQAFEGDIGLDPVTREFVNGKLTPEQAFKGVYQNRIWPGARIYYKFGYSFDQRRRQLMVQAMDEYHRKTCVRFQPRRSERAYIEMINEPACWSIIGRNGGRQLLKMGNFCLQKGTAIHELMHAVGFYHEQSRYDRDEYVRIFWNNIQRGQDYNFQKYRSDYYGQAYDLNSIMHYRNNEFGAYGRNTIQSIKNPSLRLGNTQFSAADIRAINRMYKCSGSSGINPPPTACADENSSCNMWMQRGECDRNPRYMKTKCRASCRVC